MSVQKGKPKEDSRTTEILLKSRVKELETEVAKLKNRLDDLRKAKNQTVLKREREIIQVGLPFGRRNSKTSASSPDDTCSNLKTNSGKSTDSDEMEMLRMNFDAEMQLLQDKLDKPVCDHEEELMILRKDLADLASENGALQIENADLKDRVESLVSELSVKEAKWCDVEEQITIKVKFSWQQKYQQWMEATEAKITELQQTNMLLRAYLKKQKPTGSDPSRQEPDEI